MRNGEWRVGNARTLTTEYAEYAEGLKDSGRVGLVVWRGGTREGVRKAFLMVMAI